MASRFTFDTLGFVLSRIYSAAVYGVDAYEVEIEVNAGHGDPKIIIVGLPDTAVKESQDRVTTAINNSGYYWPRGRTTINLAPADIKKEGPSFDLPIALGMIAAAQEIDRDLFGDFCFVGELALSGGCARSRACCRWQLKRGAGANARSWSRTRTRVKPRWSPELKSMAQIICARFSNSCPAKNNSIPSSAT